MTITAGGAVTRTDHDGLPAAHRALMAHAVAEDLYVHAIRSARRGHPLFVLLAMLDAHPRPQIIGIASISPSVPSPTVEHGVWMTA